MAPPANWKGYLKLSLVSCPIVLYPASTTAGRVTFNTINRKTGNRVQSVYVDPVSREPVEPDDQVKGYAVGKDEFVYVEESELDALQIESSRTIDIGTFVPRSEIDPRFMDTPYYITPENKIALDAFAVIRDAMKDASVVGLGRVVVARRERIIMLEPWGKGLLGMLLRYGYEVRDAAPYFDKVADVQLPTEVVALSRSLIEAKSGHFDSAEFVDRYQEALSDLVKTKQAKLPVEEVPAAEPVNVVNLMEALRKSLGGPAAPAGKAEVASKVPKGEPARKKRGT